MVGGLGDPAQGLGAHCGQLCPDGFGEGGGLELLELGEQAA
jgi:hypothetical protein